ncbi:uncharacterized protein LOC134660715 [Cydia amplana]|uniref:uncharacterized protein LOC134660715 n=1 Tax=Cydia amplana TaxID=1869771 RepID=UPI002FE54242
MNLIPNCLYLVMFLFIHVTNEETTTEADTLKKDKITDTINKINNPNLKENVKNNDEHQTGSPQFDMKDFKVKKLKSHHFEDEDTTSCLANIDPAKIEAVKKSIRNNDGKVEYVPADPQHVNDEDIKIANCLKREAKDNKDNKEPNENSGKTKSVDAKEGKINKEATNATKDKINLNTVEEEDTVNDKPGRRDTEYQFEPLLYYDDEMVFDNTTCPDKVEVIELQLGEVKTYDMECSMITHWTGLLDPNLSDE